MASVFPHLTGPEFIDACNRLIDRFRQHGCDQTQWQTVELIEYFETKYLRITKLLRNGSTLSEHGRHETNDDEVKDEGDEEALFQPDQIPTLVNYDIILSPSYRVPVLYITISEPLHRYPPTLNVLYDHLVPAQFKAQAQHVGMIGGVTITDHPSTNRPVFFIHPCQTTEVMTATVAGRTVSPEQYLIIWIGALGKCVGLDIPLCLMQVDKA